MKKTFTLFAAILLLAVGAAAQKLSYQAVVRNSANELVYDATVSVSLKILAADGVTVQYAETQTTTTNQNGLLTLIIGEHPTGTYSLANVNWTDASIRTDITLPSGDVVTNTMPVTAVPYALYADDAGGNLNQVQSNWTETNTASKAYIQNKPTIPTAVSQLTNDVHYITVNEVPVQVQSDWAETNTASTAYIQNKPAIPTSVGQLTNDVHYITVNEVPAQVQSDWAETNTASTAYIQNKPAIPTVPTNVSAFQNDAHYITVNEVPVQVQSDWAETNTASTAYIQNKPTIPTSVGQLTNDVHYITVNEVPVQVQSDWAETNTASTAYIQNKPAIPTSVGQLTNDVHYITVNEVPVQVQSDWAETNTASTAYIQNKPAIPVVHNATLTLKQGNATLGTFTANASVNQEIEIPTQAIPDQVNADWNATDGPAKILNKPTIPTVPTSVSAFQNDAGYLTSYTETDPQFNAWDKDYNDLTNKPTIPTVPTNVSAFQNDAQYVTQTQLDNAGYLTGYTETDPQFNAWDKDYNDLTNKPTIPTVPTSVSAFQNDAGYLTSYTETDPQFNAWDKDYNDLTNKPNIPVVNNATLTIKQGNATLGTFTANASTDQEIEIPTQAIPDQVNADWNATTGPAQILNKPTIPTVPTNVSAFQNDAHYVTQTQMESAGYLTRDSIAVLQQTVNNLVTLVNSLNIRMTQEQFTTTAGQTVFTLQHAPKQDCIIRCYVNGLMVGGNHNGVLDVNANNNMQLEYSAAFNHNYVLKANDKVTIVYWY